MKISIGDLVTWGTCYYAYPVVAEYGRHVAVEVPGCTRVLVKADCVKVNRDNVLPDGEILNTVAARPSWTWLGIFNYFLLQWFFIRLTRVDWPGVIRAKTTKPVERGQLVSSSDIDMTTAVPACSWELRYFIWPLSGWEGKPYRTVGRPFRLRLP